MLVIKNAQIDKFIAEDDTQLVKIISDIVREAYADGIGEYTDEQVAQMARIAIKKAISRGFERPEDIAAFAALMFEISPEFDMHEAIDAFLKDESIPVEYRIEQLLGRMPEEVWRSAQETYDARVWFPDPEESAE